MLVLLLEGAFASDTSQLFAVGGYGGSFGTLSSVGALSSPGGSWVAEANGLNVARY